MMRLVSAALVLSWTVAQAFAVPGDLDLTFAGSGKTQLAFGAAADDFRGMVIQADGKMVVASTSSSAPSPSTINLTRYNSDGSRDATFGVGGRIVTRIGLACTPAGIALQNDGKIVVGGNVFLTQVSGQDYLVLRYNPDGSLDSSFDGDGIVTTNIDASDAAA